MFVHVFKMIIDFSDPVITSPLEINTSLSDCAKEEQCYVFFIKRGGGAKLAEIIRGMKRQYGV